VIPASVRTAWEAAYRQADYCVLLPAGELVLRVDRHLQTDDQRLREGAGVVSHWAMITPCNPGSQMLSAKENRQRLDEFSRILQELHIRSISSVNRNPQVKWQDEPGFLLCDPPPNLAEQLGRRFRQNAILVGRLADAPQLLWLID